MAKRNPWHSAEPGTEVYHDNTDCELGNNIERENIRPGTGGHRKCSRCAELDSR